ncbi:PucR family transcriptional regulator [Pseudalkalibacillus decolorationis]|uniref:PucR family transcriptional regulator n=1 Tax=Pseudalkalibacillus decolorationis TaxID=163879 RepID=UPI0021486171|nr:PucR family transcriptional regulator [Pseudalkalibacillus decolorationis]
MNKIQSYFENACDIIKEEVYSEGGEKLITSYKLTVKDILNHPYFIESELKAGVSGLDREIKWVHIMEVTQIGKLLNGNELILTTGVGWQEKQTSLSFLKQLIEANVAGVCVELDTYISDIPEEMILLAEQYNFPLIIFKKEVRFIDITQNLNTSLMNYHYKMIADLEIISNKLNEILLLPDAFKRILRFLSKTLHVQVVYIPTSEKEALFTPEIPMEQREILLDRVEGNLSKENLQKVLFPDKKEKAFAYQSIQAMGHKFADLLIFSETETFNEYEQLVLDRSATALSQDLLRILYVEERKKVRENQWAKEWLDGKHSKEDIQNYFSALNPSFKPNGGTVSICTFDTQIDNSNITYYLAVLRSIFEQHGFHPVITFEANQIVSILINKRGKNDWKTRVCKAIEQLIKTDQIRVEDSSAPFGIGKLVDELDQVHESYRMAKEVLLIQKKKNLVNTPFYEDLHVYRLISLVNKHSDLEQFIMEYLGAVIEYDKNNNGNLMETLKVLLDSSGSKKEASKKLFIVRQTLYHRIDKLKELLGDDFMNTEKRLAIEFSLSAWKYMNKQ